MRPQTNFVRSKMFQLREKRRHLSQLETMTAEFERMAAELEAQITAEEKRTGITDTEHFAYPIFAKAARQRRDNLLNSIRNLQSQKDVAELSLHQAQAELEHAQALEKREGQPLCTEENITFVQRCAMIG